MQTKFDSGLECQVAADSLKDVYRGLLELRKDSCVRAREAAAQAEQNCVGQAECLEAQKKALAAYQAAVAKEIAGVKHYQETINQVANYAITDLAAAGTMVLEGIQQDQATPDDGSSRYGPRGKGWAALWLKAASNKQAMEEVFHNENRARAEAVVEKFKQNSGRESDITGLKSDFIKEPLRVAEASREWNQKIGDYVHSLEAGKAALAQQAGLVQAREKTMNAQPKSNAPGARSISNLSSAKPEGRSQGDATGQNSASADGATTGGISGSSLPSFPGASQTGNFPGGAEGAGFPSSGTAASGGLAQAIRGAAGQALGKNPGQDSGVFPADGKAASSPAEQKKTEKEPESEALGALGGGKLALPQDGASGSSRRIPASLRNKVAAGFPGARGAAESGGAQPETAGSPKGGGKLAAPAADGESYALPMEGGLPGSANSNELAVEKIVSDWSGSIFAGRKEGSAPSGSVSADPQEEGADSLFARVSGAHLRALRRGLVIRGIRARL